MGLHLGILAMLLAPLGAGQVRSEMLATTEWLAANLSDPKVVVLHVGHDKAAYDAGHIPGARFVAWSELTATRRGVPNELPPVEQLVKLFERLGVSGDSRVILYGDNLGQSAARAWFTLDYLGHGERAALLDGGLEKWRAESRPVSQQEPDSAPARLTPRLRPEVVVNLEAMRDLSWAAANGAGSGFALLDARTPADYASHIPGAANLYWMDGLAGKDNPVLRPAAELRRLFESAGAAPGSKVVTYCNSGVRASHLYFVARYLGYDAALYDGSLTEWSKAEGTQLTGGESRK